MFGPTDGFLLLVFPFVVLDHHRHKIDQGPVRKGHSDLESYMNLFPLLSTPVLSIFVIVTEKGLSLAGCPMI